MKVDEASRDTCREVGVVAEVPMMFFGLFRCFLKAKTASESFFPSSADGLKEDDEKACTSSRNKLRRPNRIRKRVVMMAIICFVRMMAMSLIGTVMIGVGDLDRDDGRFEKDDVDDWGLRMCERTTAGIAT
jgi:hypothetical protein